MATSKFLDKLLEKVDRIDRLRLEEYIQDFVREKRLFRDILNKLDEGIIILDTDFCIDIINSRAERLLGITDKNNKNKKITKCRIDPRLIDLFEKYAVSRKEGFREEIFVVYPNKQLLRLNINPLRESGESQISAWLISILDITEDIKKNTQQFQTEKQRAIIMMASILAHELGNPLNSLAIHLQLINRAVRSLPKKHKDKILNFLSISESEVKRLDSIVTRFLQASRPLKPIFVKEDVQKIINETLKLLSPEIRKNKIRIEKEFNDNLPLVYLDHIQLRQAFINIIKNAIESMPHNGKLIISTDISKDKLKISFIDNGIGISNVDLKNIFEPYFTTKHTGSGLGLVIVDKIIQRHGGRIEIKSKIGGGTTIAIYLQIGPLGPKLIAHNHKS